MKVDSKNYNYYLASEEKLKIAHEEILNSKHYLIEHNYTQVWTPEQMNFSGSTLEQRSKLPQIGTSFIKWKRMWEDIEVCEMFAATCHMIIVTIKM